MNCSVMGLYVTEPFSGCSKLATVKLSPSGSVSFISDAIATGVSISVVSLSLLATTLLSGAGIKIVTVAMSHACGLLSSQML